MDTKRICPGCQKPLPAHVPEGLCPECLLKVALGTGVEPGPDTQGAGGRTHFVAPTPDELRPLFPELEIISLLGQGGMGAVYKARQKTLDRIVALKILPPGSGADPAFAERFTREARALARLSHPGVVTLYEFGHVPYSQPSTLNPQPLYFFLMEYVDGVSLRRLLERGRLSAREALAIVPQICDALQYAHDQGIVHRDIKPENILLDRVGRVKVADFGVAKLVGLTTEGSASGQGVDASVMLTESGKMLGTPAYMAPEQADNPQEADHRADIYSLGVVFYQMLTGELPGKPLQPPSRKVQIDVRLDSVVLRALEREPERRYQQVSVLKTQVETLAATPAPAASAQPGGTRSQAARARTISALALFLLAPVGFAWFLLFGHQQMAVDLRADLLFWLGTLGFPAAALVGTIPMAALLLGWKLENEAPVATRWSWLAIGAVAVLVLSLPLGGAAAAIAVLLRNENNWHPSTQEAVVTFTCFAGVALTGAAATLVGAAALNRMNRAGQLLRGRWGALASAWFWPCVASAMLVCAVFGGVTARRPAEQITHMQAAVSNTMSAIVANEKLQQARNALIAEPKDVERARELLREIVAQGKASLDPSELCHAYVYLGYIEDRAGNRQAALPWYRLALEVSTANEAIRDCATRGLEQPLTWIRHLDEATQPEPGEPPPVKSFELGGGYVTSEQPPARITPANRLSAEERRANFEFLCQAIDRTYAGFELKGINWREVCGRYRERLGGATNAEAFYLLLFGLVNELRDTHSWLQNYRPALPTSAPAVTVELFDGKPFVVAVGEGSDAARAGIKPGAEVLEIDGQTVEQRMERLKSQLPGRSSERGFQQDAARYLLAGDRGSSLELKLRGPSAEPIQTCSLKRDAGLSVMPALPRRFELTKQRFVHFGRHPVGPGYIWLESFNGRNEIAAEFDRALQALRDAPSLILDIRDNAGGFGTAQPHIVGRFITNRTLMAIGYVKNGPGHHELSRHEESFEPAGSWQYRAPVALLVNEGTGSAADLFACYLRSAGRVITVGSTTHGNLSGVAAYAVLPCGLVVRISNGYVCDAKDQAVEGNGTVPEVRVSPSITDFLKGKDPVLDKAVEVLAARTPKP